MNELLKAKSEFRKKGVTLIADKQKQGAGGSWKFASEDNLIKTIQTPLTECGLEIVSSLKYYPELNVDSVEVTLYHVESGQSITSAASLMPIIPRKDKNGNSMYLDAEIERGKQFGYLSRTLSIRLLGLSDIDAEDTANMPENLSDEPMVTNAQLREIKALMLDTSTDVEKFIEFTKSKGFLFNSIEAATKKEGISIISMLTQKKVAMKDK